jgi:hypothetical protein
MRTWTCVFFISLPFGTASAQEAQPPLRVLVACTQGQLTHYEKWLEQHYHVKCSWAGNDGKKKEEKGLKELEALERCDVMLLNLYRVQPTPEQLTQIQDYFKKGKPVVGLRKASHAIQTWLEIDQVVFGAKYGGHFFENKKEQTVVVDPKAKDHPLIGDFKPFMCGGGLYNYTKLAPDVEVLMSGGPPGKSMPVTWQRIDKETGGRAFYTRYDPNDLKNDEGLRHMVARALFWAAKRELRKK